MRAPLLFAAAAGGVLCGARWSSPAFFAAALAAALSGGFAAAALRRRARVLSLAVFAAAAALGGYAASLSAQVPRDSLGRVLDALSPGESAAMCIRGVVREEAPLSGESAGASKRYLVSVRSLRSRDGFKPASGNVYLYTGEPLPFGAGVQLSARFFKPAAPRNPGQFDYAAYLERNGVVGIAFAPHEGLVRITQPPRGLHFRRAIAAIKRAFAARIERLGLAEGGIIPAVLLGDRSGLSAVIKERFARSGTMHLLAISGLHLGVVVTFVWWLLRVARAPAGAAAGAAIAAAVLYALIAGARPPVVRAALMAVLFALAAILYRRALALSVVATAALAMLLWRPLEIFDPGFQMSFAAVLGLFYLGRPAARYLQGLVAGDGRLKNRLLRGALGGLGWSLGAWAGVAPPAAWHFHIFTPVAPLANLILVPVTATMVIAGFLAVGVSLVSLKLASLFALSARGAQMTLEGAVDLLAKVPGGYFYVGSLGRFRLAAVIIFLVCCAVLAASRRRALPLVTAGLIAANLALYGALAFGAAPDASLRTLVDGESAAVVLIDGAGTCVVFAGRSADRAFARRVICPYLLERGFPKVDLLVETAGADARVEDVIALRFPLGAVLRQRRFRGGDERPGGGRLFGPGDSARIPGGPLLWFHSARTADFDKPGSPYHPGLICEIETGGKRAVVALDVTTGCIEAARGRISPRPDTLVVCGGQAGADVLAGWREELSPRTFTDAAEGPAASGL